MLRHRKDNNRPYVGDGRTILSALLIGSMLTSIVMQIKMIAVVSLKFEFTWELALKTIISIIYAVVGAVLLGWQGTCFQNCKAASKIGKQSPLEIWDKHRGVQFPPIPPSHYSRSPISTRSDFVFISTLSVVLLRLWLRRASVLRLGGRSYS
jgi:hypothetical protein